MKKTILLVLTFFITTAMVLAVTNNKAKKTNEKTSQPNTVLANPHYNHAYQGKKSQLRLIVSNSGTIGRAAWNEQSGSVTAPPETLGMEYPAGSGFEHIFGGGIWIGGIVDTSAVQGTNPPIKLVSTSYEGNSANKELYPGSTRFDTLLMVHDNVKPAIWDTIFPGVQFKTYRSRPEIFYCKYRDYNTGVPLQDHIPMGIEVIQKSFSWTNENANNIIPIDISIINKSDRVIHNAYLGYFIDTDIGPYNQTSPSYSSQNYSGYDPSLRLAYAHNPVAKGCTPIGCVYIASPKTASNLHFSYQWFDVNGGGNPITSNTDQERYDNLMAANTIAPNQSPAITALSDTRFIFSFGPFDINPKDSTGKEDTLNIVVAVIAGDPPGLEHLKKTARHAIEIYKLGYELPYVPPSPNLTTTIGTKRISLKWDNFPENHSWDDSNRIAEHDTLRHPADSNATRPRGGLVFEGYRIYRSNDPSAVPPKESFTLLRQYDKIDGFEFDTGLEYEFNDDSLLRGNTYWYAVTTLSIPNEFIQVTPHVPADGTFDTTYVKSPPVESAISENMKKIVLPFATATKKNQVLVVPNPYRVDQDYTYENGGWEGKTNNWSENNRLIRFIYLPKQCTIRVYSLAGDLVTTIDHNDPNRGEETWNLLSQSNRAIASGIYIFSVQSEEFGTQVGKFVIIR